MANDQTEKVLFEVRLNAEQLKAEADKVRAQQRGLTTDIDATRAAQKKLAAEYKAGTVTQADYATQAQQLSEQLRTQTREQQQASKQLENLGRASGDAEGSINQLRADLALTTASYNALSREERDNTEAGKALQARTRAISDELKGLESAVGDNRRNVGNYSGSLQQLVKEMVKLRAEEKNLAAGSEELAQNQKRQIGFQIAAQKAAAQAGQTYEEATKTIENYTKAIQPAVEQLVDLEAEQARLIESGEGSAEALRKIGFQIGAANKSIEEAAPKTKSFAGALVEAAGESEVLGGTVQKLNGFQEKYIQLQNLARLAMGASTGAAKILKVALAATGIGVFLVVLGSLVTYFTQTAEGGRIVEQVFAQLGAVVDVLTDRIGTFGKAIVQVFKGDFAGAAETAKASFRGVGDEIQRETRLSLELSKARQQLEIDQARNISTNKRLLAQVEAAKNIRDDETNSIARRTQANEEAYKLEMQRQNILADLAKRNLDIIRQEIEMRGGEAKATLEQRRALGEAENEYYDVIEDSNGKQNELITNRVSLQKEAEEQRRKLVADSLNYDLARIDAELARVTENSDRQLALEKAKLEKQRALSLNEADLTAKAKQAIEVKYRSDLETLNREHLQRLRQQAAESQQIAIAAQLARAREGSQEEFLLKAQAIQADLQAGLAAIDTRQSKEQQAAQADKLRAEAAQKQAELEYQNALAGLEAYLAQQRTLTNQQYANNEITKAQHEAALAAIERSGQAARIVTLQDYGRSTIAEEENQSQQRVQTADNEKNRKQQIAEQEIQIRFAVVAATQQGTDTIINLFGEESAAGQAALAVKKVLAVTEIALNLQKELSAIAAAAAANPANAVTAGVAGVSQSAILSGIAIAKAAFATAQVLAFADGGLVLGPGGPKDDLIPAYLSNGEAVMTAQAVQLFGPMLSWMNQAGGGKSFGYRDPMPTATMARYAEGGVVRYDASYMAAMAGRSGGSEIDYQQLARAVAQEVGPVFYAANKALPRQTVVLSELREKQDKQARNEARGNL
ncbi:coiled-coil domain-containing protein [Hymenobacter pini]|uniref:hypothetical protein n=1 Tax=Hymenobacter pini TaxID=2880879 RepID=UPI001CF5D444|nr:hypothetical protein [Hymenobacter pini]MCA8830285.1 hypothetical protein [Hymenobacter pini]